VLRTRADRDRARALLRRATGRLIEVTLADGERRRGRLEELRENVLLLADPDGLPDTVDLQSAQQVRFLKR